MVVSELRQVYRLQTNDINEPYLVDDETFLIYLNEAQCQAALRANLIYDNSSTFCTIPVLANKGIYPLDDRIYQIVFVSFIKPGPDDVAHLYDTRLQATSSEQVIMYYPNWRDLSSRPNCFIQLDKTIEIIPKSDTDGSLHIEAYRLPLADMEDDDEEPEIQRTHHLNLIDWVLYRAYSMPDVDIQNTAKADFFEKRFSRIFGNEPHATTRREQQADLPHHNRACF